MMQRLCCNLSLSVRSSSTASTFLIRNSVFHRDAASFIRNSQVVTANSKLTFQHRFQSNKPLDDDSGHYKIATIPNGLCILRIGVTPLIGSLVVSQQFTPAFALFVGAGFTDLMDGYIARNFKGQKSLLGSVLDPVADKLLVSVMFVTMTHAGLIPAPLTFVVILRDVCLIVGGFYKRYRTMEPPYSMNRFFNPEVSSIQIVPTMISKINTVLQLCVVAFSLAGPVFEFGEGYHQAVSALNWTTAATTIYSGLQYASGRAFKKL